MRDIGSLKMMADNSSDSTPNLTTLNTDKNLKEALSNPVVAITSTLLLILMVLIILGNLMVIRTVYVTPKLHCPAFYFVISLAVADFMVGFLVPLSLVYNISSEMTGKWMAGEIACDVWTFANIWFVCASLLNLCVVSWDRYIAVTSPLTYKFVMHGKKIKVFIVIVWSLSLLMAVIYTVEFKLSEERRLCVATSGLTLEQTVPSVIIIYVIPTLFLLFVNGRVIQIARKHRRHIQIQEITVSNLSVSNPHEANRNMRLSAIVNELKTFKTFVIVIGTFVLCWSPFFLLTLLNHFVELPSKLPHVAVILFYVKSGLNPMIYGTHNKELRTAAADSLNRRRRIESNSSEPETNDLPTELPESDVIIPNKLRENYVETTANDLRDVNEAIPRTNTALREMNIPMSNELRENDLKSVNDAESRRRPPLQIEDILAKPS
ncbi:octopamine receptor 1-like [Actinia tenebrosa]|uniref:Octopamine receptor 1-like n=1 Tax=Actinia tenebrosa TaxID=6105 RepID=A0A6P8IKI2_ACTTE|nr:octopamine receptor 1-like [Actinia tenebrosa]